MTSLRAWLVLASAAGIVRAAGLRPASPEVPRTPGAEASRDSLPRPDAGRAWVPDAAPLAAGTITSGYAARRRHPLLGRDLPHWGVDVAAPHGAPVLATADGVVLATFRSPAYGLGVDLRHGEWFLTRYAHLSALTVRRGEPVRRGQAIGRVGATGRATGPHLHYEAYVRRGGGYRSIDPLRIGAGVRRALPDRSTLPPSPSSRTGEPTPPFP